MNIMLYVADFQEHGQIYNTRVLSLFVTTNAAGDPSGASNTLVSTGDWASSSAYSGATGFNFIDSLRVFGDLISNLMFFPLAMITMAINTHMPATIIWLFIVPMEVIYIISLVNIVRGSNP
jgi:hypothetical protein